MHNSNKVWMCVKKPFRIPTGFEPEPLRLASQALDYQSSLSRVETSPTGLTTDNLYCWQLHRACGLSTPTQDTRSQDGDRHSESNLKNTVSKNTVGKNTVFKNTGCKNAVASVRSNVWKVITLQDRSLKVFVTDTVEIWTMWPTDQPTNQGRFQRCLHT